jgi:hypothetical protein
LARAAADTEPKATTAFEEVKIDILLKRRTLALRLSGPHSKASIAASLERPEPEAGEARNASPT